MGMVEAERSAEYGEHIGEGAEANNNMEVCCARVVIGQRLAFVNRMIWSYRTLK